MKTQTPTKRTAHRLAAALAIATALATSGAWAAESFSSKRIDDEQTMLADWTVSGNPGWLALGWDSANTGILHIGSYNLTVSGNLLVGHSGRGELYLDSGTVNANTTDSNRTLIGNNSSATGVAVINGGTFTSNGEMSVGESGTGELTINENGTVDAKKALYVGKNANSTGTLTISDGGSATVSGALYVGNNGTGTLNLNGGTVDAKGLLYLGNIANSTGTLTISDGGSATVNGAFYVGNNGTGTLNLNGGTLTAKSDFKINKGTFNGTAGTLELTSSGNAFTVGSANNTGTVDKDGGDWSCYHLYIGNGSNVAGSFTHDGGTLTVAPSSYPFVIGGNSGTGEFTLNGGTVTVGSGNVTSLGFNNTGNGTLNLNGGTLITKQVKKNTTSGTCVVVFNGGTLKANYADNNGLITSGVTANVGASGGTIDSGNLSIKVGAAIGGTGAMKFKGGNTITLQGANSYTGGTTIELGTKVLTSDADAMNAIVGNLVVDCSTCFADTDNIEVFEYSAGGLTKDNVTFINEGDGTEAKVSADGKKILVDFKARPWATVSADTTWSALVAAAGGTPASDASVSVKMSGNYTLTIDADVTVGQIAFSNGDVSTLVVNNGATLTVNDITGISKITNNGTLVKSGEGTATLPFDNTSTGVTVVNSGTLKVASRSGTGTAHTVRVKSGATFDMNGIADNVVHVVLEEGANLANTRAAIGNTTQQAKSITLEGDATATATANFGLVGAGYAETTLALGSNTLTLNGSAAFWLVNTTIAGDGTLYVDKGVLQCHRHSSSGTDCTVAIGTDGTFRIEASYTLTVKNFVNGGHINTDGHGTLAVTGTFTPGSAAIPKLTLANGATVKATGTAQVVSTTFAASGTITVDASEIDAQTLKAAGETGIPVLTVPTAQVPSGVIWAVSGAPIDGTRAKWRTDEGSSTKTLYIARPTGLMVIFR